MSVEVRSQKIARAAFQQVEARGRQPKPDRYLSFARTFPTLIHTCGLAQTAAFALAKKEEKLLLLDDLAQVMNAADSGWQFADGAALDDLARRPETDVWTYLRLTRQALQSATWIKRYAEALLTLNMTLRPDEADTDTDADPEVEEAHDATGSP